MDTERRAQLKAAYREIPVFYGVIKLTNTANDKAFIASYPNLKNKELVLRAQLDDGRHPNGALQADWREYGNDAFVYEVLEQKDASQVNDARYAAKHLEEQWIERLRSSGNATYHKT
jgi:hypothetical protein